MLRELVKNITSIIICVAEIPENFEAEISGEFPEHARENPGTCPNNSGEVPGKFRSSSGDVQESSDKVPGNV